jgi:hypothetical protein
MPDHHRNADREATPLPPVLPEHGLTAPTLELVDLIKALTMLITQVPTTLHRACLGDMTNNDWADMGNLLIASGHLCHDQRTPPPNLLTEERP